MLNSGSFKQTFEQQLRAIRSGEESLVMLLDVSAERRMESEEVSGLLIS